MASRTDSDPVQLAAQLARLQGYLHQDPDNVRLLADVADAQLQLALWDAARSTLGRILSLTPEDPLARYRLAVADHSQGLRDVAARSLLALLAEGHEHPVIRWRLARCLAEAADWPGVCSALETPPLDQLPANLLDDWALLQARAFHHQGSIAQAVSLMQQWQVLCGERGLPLQGRCALATLLLDNEQAEAAAALLARCTPAEIQTQPELSTVAGYLALSEGRGSQALGWFQHSLSLSAGSARAKLGAGLAEAMQGHSDLALQSLKAAVALSPAHLGSWHALAWVQLLAQDLDGAESSVRAALNQDETFGESHGGLALILVLKEQPDEARRRLRTALKLNPQGFNAMVAQWMLANHQTVLTPDVLQKLQQAFEGHVETSNPMLAALLKRWHAH
ncbi:tetratricopeptide repeat protein [Roseateles sp. DB2]|uniref:tetratricopeptide repeat protein n=1 Tax=Roseateles sp. DB2 TaxID=3453717 RepID=UPI003EECA65C